MPTKTPTAPLSTTEAEALRTDLIDRIHAGENVDPLDIVRAEAAIDMGRRLEARASERKAAEAEERRLAQIDKLRGDVEALRGVDLTEMFDRAVAAVRELVEAGQSYERESGRINRELARLRPYPADAVTSGPRARGVLVTTRATVTEFAGVHLHTNSSQPLGHTLAAAVLDAVGPGPMLSASERRSVSGVAARVGAKAVPQDAA